MFDVLFALFPPPGMFVLMKCVYVKHTKILFNLLWTVLEGMTEGKNRSARDPVYTSKNLFIRLIGAEP